MRLQEINGLKYPDEYFIKFFFKYQLHKKQNQTFLELGCSNGCNLMLPYQFDNSVIGVDLNNTLIQYANDNFKQLQQNNHYKFNSQDMIDFCKQTKDIQADILILASSIYYIPKDDFTELLKNIKNNNLIKENIPFYIRFRDIDDFRNGKGKSLGENSIIIQNGITGEDGVFCRFYAKDEMIEILKEELNLRDFQTMVVKYENIQNNIKVNNSDIVIWGTIN
jgi:hypothetical protein